MLKNIKPIHIVLAVSLALNMAFIGSRPAYWRQVPVDFKKRQLD